MLLLTTHCPDKQQYHTEADALPAAETSDPSPVDRREPLGLPLLTRERPIGSTIMIERVAQHTPTSEQEARSRLYLYATILWIVTMEFQHT